MINVTLNEIERWGAKWGNDDFEFWNEVKRVLKNSNCGYIEKNK